MEIKYDLTIVKERGSASQYFLNERPSKKRHGPFESVLQANAFIRKRHPIPPFAPANDDDD
jgi:hypothetical protein